ncbi:hypothetical protein QBC44DRAFT_388096 [Cladorrhinum sp. PSN332]|nr:hypothetical protein QBC44DRAFT_388096 [Cladorrhinum sp. PSN332]
MEYFTSFPGELINEIVSKLDPVTLISLSQSTKSFRQLVNPIRHDFEQQLLALELTTEYGGIVPTIKCWPSSRRIELRPSRHSDAWRSNRYACLGCMKLLPHYMFSEGLLLSLEYRKPAPGTFGARVSSVTDWQALPTGGRWKHIQKQHEILRQNRIRMIKAKVDLVHPTAEMETQLAGIWRHKRRCIECKYQKGSHSTNLTNNDRLPAVMTGKREYSSSQHGVQRWYPGLLTYHTCQYVSPQFRNVAMVRCPGCKTWQEYRAFGHFSFPLTRMPAGRQCYRCYIKAQGRSSSTALALCSQLLGFIDDPCENFRMDFFQGWDTVKKQYGRGEMLARHKIPELLVDFVPVRRDPSWKSVDLTDELLKQLRPIFNEYRGKVYGTRANPNLQWLAQYDRRERELFKRLRQIEMVKAVCEQKPEVIFDYFTQPEPFYWTGKDLLERFGLVNGVVVPK